VGLLTLLFHTHRFRMKGPFGGRCACGTWAPPSADPQIRAARLRFDRHAAHRTKGARR